MRDIDKSEKVRGKQLNVQPVFALAESRPLDYDILYSNPAKRKNATPQKVMAFFGGAEQAKSEPIGFGFACVGGPEGIRTLDPYNANVMRSRTGKNYAPQNKE